MTLAELGHQLRRAGLTEQALLAWAGTRRLSSLPAIADALARRPVTPAATALALFVAGVELSIDRVKLPVDVLAEHGLVAVADDRVRAAVAILPLGQALLVCDRLDAPASSELVCCPDDSSYHLASALPAGRRARWIDLATGSAFAPLARPDLATTIRASDANPRAVGYARLGAALSSCGHVDVEIADIGVVSEPAELVTCNAPIPDDADAAMWRSTDRAFFARLWTRLPRSTAPGGDIVVHCTRDAIPDDLAGDVAIVVYTPPGERAYAITWWTPDAPTRRRETTRLLTTTRPHLEPSDRG